MLGKTFYFIRSPLLHLQAAYFLLRMKKLADPQGALYGETGQGHALKILMLGDSSALGVGCATIAETATGSVIKQLSAQFKIHYHICAFTGFTTAKVFDEVKKLSTVDFDYIIVSLGSNDIVSGNAFMLWQQQNRDLFDYIETHIQPHKIIISAIPPFNKVLTIPRRMRNFLGLKAQQMNRHLIDYARQNPKFDFVDLDYDFKPEYISADGFHPSAVLYAIQGQRLASRILHFHNQLH